MERWQAILDFWFGKIAEPDYPPSDRYKLWFGKDAATDQTIRENFEPDLKRAASGDYASWENLPKSLLALVILNDQFPRNIYRDNPGAFAYDEFALNLVLYGIENQFDQQLFPIERVFFYLPLEHSENFGMQEKSVVMYRKLIDGMKPEIAKKYQGYLDYAVKHFEIVKRFGRFPHRNRIFGRESTAAEIEFLSQPGSSF